MCPQGLHFIYSILPVTLHDQSNFDKPFLFLEIQAGRTNLGFPKTFRGRYSAFIEYLYNRSPKNFKILSRF